MFTSLALSTLFLVLNADVSKLSLQAKIERIARSSEGIVGVAVLGLEDRNLITLNPAKHFPMQSVYKFPLALAVLKQVDEGKLKLDQNIHVTKQDLLPDT